jgi:hypothetical protein
MSATLTNHLSFIHVCLVSVTLTMIPPAGRNAVTAAVARHSLVTGFLVSLVEDSCSPASLSTISEDPPRWQSVQAPASLLATAH